MRLLRLDDLMTSYTNARPGTGLLVVDPEKLNSIWPTIPEHRFAEVDKAFGQWESSGINTILCGIDDEIHVAGRR
ncbi:MAG TPA: hypothetical protein VG297_05400 [Bryobacteraceae bacterium]|jgi:hypothetical protein|nr:hypothetical protein [Bryobacteraceae bacterium]